MSTLRTSTIFLLLTALLGVTLAGCASATPTATQAPASAVATQAPALAAATQAPALAAATQAPTSAAATQAPTSAAAASTKHYTIGVSTNALANLHNENLFNWTQADIQKDGDTAVMVNANGDAVQQLKDIEDLIQRHVNVLIVQNGDVAALASGIKEAAAANIPVVSVETGYTPGVVVELDTNEFVIGATIAGYLSAQIGDQGKVATIYHTDVHSIRVRGYEIEAVEKEYTGLQVVAHHRSIFPGTTDDAYAWMQTVLLAHPDIVAVFCSQDLEAIGVARAITAAGRKDIITIGVDGEPDALQIIKDGGPIIATVIQDITQESNLSADAAHKLAAGQSLGTKVIFIPFTFVTKDNVDQFLSTATPTATP
jgi:ribose transport system substrate-binding protein